MNKEVIRSWVFKLLPVVMAFVVGKGWATAADTETAVSLVDKVWTIVDEILLAAATGVTLFRSLKTHGASKDGITG